MAVDADGGTLARWRGREPLPLLLVGLLAYTSALLWCCVRIADRLIRPGEVRGNIGQGTAAFIDWRDATHLPGADLLAGRDPYAVAGYLSRHPGSQEFDLYGPHHLLLLGWTGALPYSASVLAGVVILAAATLAFAAALLLVAGAPARPGGTALLAAGLLMVLPGRSGFLAGQITPIVGLGCVLAWHWNRTRPWLAAAGLALALLKPQFGVVLAVVLLLGGGWRVVARGAALAFAASVPVLVVLLVVEGGPVGLLRTVADNAAYAARISAAEPDSQRIDVVGALDRQLGDVAGGWTVLLVALLLTCAGVVLHLARARGRDPWHDPACVAAACLVVLLSVVHQQYDVVLVAWPLAVAVGAAWQRRREPRARLAPAAIAVALALPLLLPRRAVVQLPLLDRLDPLSAVTAWLVLALAVAAAAAVLERGAVRAAPAQ